MTEAVKEKTVTFRCSEELYQQLIEAARKDDRTRSMMVLHFVKEGLKNAANK